VPPSVADRIAQLRHAGPLDGADAVGEAAGGERLLVRVGLWLDAGRVTRARFRATTCASLLAYADAACEALEAGAPLDAPPALRARVSGVHPVHHERADLVVAAVHRARERARRSHAP
jgi:hypothetical protein